MHQYFSFWSKFTFRHKISTLGALINFYIWTKTMVDSDWYFNKFGLGTQTKCIFQILKPMAHPNMRKQCFIICFRYILSIIMFSQSLVIWWQLISLYRLNSKNCCPDFMFRVQRTSTSTVSYEYKQIGLPQFHIGAKDSM